MQIGDRRYAPLTRVLLRQQVPAGDMWRPPSFETRDCSPAFEAANGTKKSVVIDIKEPQGLANLKRMLKEADIFITNVSRVLWRAHGALIL